MPSKNIKLYSFPSDFVTNESMDYGIYSLARLNAWKKCTSTVTSLTLSQNECSSILALQKSIKHI